MRPEPPVFKLLPQRAGFRLAKKLVVFDVAPANRDLAELVPLAPVGVDRPELPSDVAETNDNSPWTLSTHLYSTNTFNFIAWCIYYNSEDKNQFLPRLVNEKWTHVQLRFTSLVSFISPLFPLLFFMLLSLPPALYLPYKFLSIPNNTVIQSHQEKVQPIKVCFSTTLPIGWHLNQTSSHWTLDLQYDYLQGPLHNHFALKATTVLNHTLPYILSPLDHCSHTLIIFRCNKIPLEKRSCITDDDRLLSESCLVLRFEVAALLGGRFRFNTSVKRLEQWNKMITAASYFIIKIMCKIEKPLYNFQS